MKVTRNIKSVINQRANSVARRLVPVLVAKLTVMVEAGELEPEYIARWWPASFDAVLAPLLQGDDLTQTLADVCANCECALPDGCEGTFRDEKACRWSKETGKERCTFVGVPSGRWPDPTASQEAPDPVFDSTDHLAGF